MDSAIAAAIAFVPALIGQGLADRVPDPLLRLFGLGIPAGMVCFVFRDAVARGTSWGKRALGLRIISVVNGAVCTSGQVWARNVLDVVPIINLFDFIWTCVDQHGQKWMDRWLRTQVVEESQVGQWSADAVEPVRSLLPLPTRWLTAYTFLVLGMGVWSVLGSVEMIAKRVFPQGPMVVTVELVAGVFFSGVALGLSRRRAWAWKANFVLLFLPALLVAMLTIWMERLSLVLWLETVAFFSALWIWPNVVYFQKRRAQFCR